MKKCKKKKCDWLKLVPRERRRWISTVCGARDLNAISDVVSAAVIDLHHRRRRRICVDSCIQTTLLKQWFDNDISWFFMSFIEQTKEVDWKYDWGKSNIDMAISSRRTNKLSFIVYITLARLLWENKPRIYLWPIIRESSIARVQ